jgi:RNA polymerase sigma-70 factor (ECF subfamily)
MGPGAAVLTVDLERSRAEAGQSDAALAARGDARAFERLYRAHVSRVLGLARRMEGPGPAEELTQDIFVRAWQKLGTFRGQAAFSTWLHRLAINVILERRRTLATRHARFVDDPATADGIGVDAAPPDFSMDFERAIQRLPPGAREVFVLHDVEGHTHREIAAMLDISPGTSKTQLHRARMLLRRHLGASKGMHHERSVD